MYDIQNAWPNAVAISLKILYIWTGLNHYLPLCLEAQKSQILINQICFIFNPNLGEIIQCDEHIFQMGWFNHQLDPFCTPHRTNGFLSQVAAGVESRRTVSLPEESRWGGVSEKPGVIKICFSLIFVQVHGLYTMWCFKTRIRFFVPDPHSSQDFPQFGAASWDSKGPKSLNAIPPLLR